MAPVPTELIGAWRRTELVVGGVPRDDADVLWLQGAEWYADVRIPHDDHGGPVEAFAGPAAWDPPHFTWHHRLDWLGSFPTDVGHLQWDRGSLIETGSFCVDDEVQPYSERWVRGDSATPRLVAVSPSGDEVAAVRVGEDAIVMATSSRGGFAVRRDRIVGDAAEPVFCRELGRASLPPLDVGGTLVIGDRIVHDGCELVVIDVG